MKPKVLLLFIFVSSVFAFECPDGMLPLGEEHKCVYFGTTYSRSLDAVRDCIRKGGDFVKITNAFENSIIYGYAGQKFTISPYIGIEKGSNGTWMYSDGSPLTYTNWGPGEPANTTDSCGVLNTDTAKWFVSDCQSLRPYICGINGDEKQCPDGWVYSASLDYCYYLRNITYADGVYWQLYNWTTSEKICNRMGGHLVSIHSQEEDDFTFNFAFTNVSGWKDGAPENDPCGYMKTWIGLFGTGDVGNGNWTDGTLVDYISHRRTIIQGTMGPWLVVNDDRCGSHIWSPLVWNGVFARFMCKQSSKKRARLEALVHGRKRLVSTIFE